MGVNTNYMCISDGLMRKEMTQLVNRLNSAQMAYDIGQPLMPDATWDRMFFRLQELEKSLGEVLPDSPTNNIKYDFVSRLKKIRHNHQMLSLGKTKEISEVQEFVGKNDYVSMLKLDGLTCSLHYSDGKLVSAQTRGNGEIGEDILHNAKWIRSIPRNIDYYQEITIDGEVIITYLGLAEYNKTHDEKYNNPRNTAAGAIRRQSAKESAEFPLTFFAWDIIDNVKDKFSEKLDMLKDLGFNVVPFISNQSGIALENQISVLKDTAKQVSIPIDGIVFKFNDVAYGASLGATAHHFNNAIAYKFIDDIFTTYLNAIEWTLGRTGVLTPVAIFEPVEIDGTEVSRASLHNTSIMHDTIGEPFIGQEVEVIKANGIIPQIVKGYEPTEKTAHFIPIPTVCPICGYKASQHKSPDGTINLMCDNPQCAGKTVNLICHYCGKTGMDIKGISKATMTKFYDLGIVNNYYDIYLLKNHRNELIKLPGFGEKSIDNILNAIEQSKNTELWRIIAAASIPLVGTAAAKKIAFRFRTYEAFRAAIDENFDFASIADFGQATDTAIHEYDYSEIDKIVKDFIIIQEMESHEQINPLNGLTFVITGKVGRIYKNRNELSVLIESKGGKVAGSVSGKTTYLICNTQEDTVKYNKAIELGIPIITESEFYERYQKQW